MTKSDKGGGGSSQTVMSPLINFQKTFSCENIFHAPSSIVVICSLDKNKDVWRHISCRSVRCFSTSVKLASRGRLQYKLNAGSEKITIAQLLITKLLLKGQFRIKAAFSYQRKVSLRSRLQFKLKAGSEKIMIAQLLITKLLLRGQFRIKAAFSCLSERKR